MKRRVVGGESFWIFWKSVRCFNPTSTIVILCHMDEKCFFAIRTRSNQKVITSKGILPHEFKAQHKSHIGKEMYIAMTGFRLNHNYIKKEDKRIQYHWLGLEQWLRLRKIHLNVFIKKDGGFHYPTIISNRVRIKGNLCVKACEITEMSFVWAHREIIILDMDELAKKLSENGRKKVVFVRQEDGAGPHNDKTYMKLMEDKFNERGWINFRHPSKSPVLNTCDACYFPIASNAVSRE